MGALVLFALLGSVGAWVFHVRKALKWEDRLFRLGVGGLIGLVCGAVVTSIAGIHLPRVWHKETWVLVDLREDSRVFVEVVDEGRGYSYRFRKKGSSESEQLSSGENVLLVCEEGRGAQLTICKEELAEEWFSWVAIVGTSVPEKYEFYIPSGTLMVTRK